MVLTHETLETRQRPSLRILNAKEKAESSPTRPFRIPTRGVGYIIPPMPPIPPSMPPPPIGAGSGLSATMASVVKSSAAIDAAF